MTTTIKRRAPTKRRSRIGVAPAMRGKAAPAPAPSPKQVRKSAGARASVAAALSATAPPKPAEIDALAAAFEAAWKMESELPEESTNKQCDAVVDRAGAFVDQILALSGTDISILRLKARAYLWAESTYPETFAKNAHYETEKLLASLFHDLGADYPIGESAPTPSTSPTAVWRNGGKAPERGPLPDECASFIARRRDYMAAYSKWLRAVAHESDESADDRPIDELRAAEEEAAAEFLAVRPPLKWMIWRKFETLERVLADEDCAGVRDRKREMETLAAIKSDLIYLGFGGGA